MKFEVTYLIDVVSKNPADYIITKIVEAEDEVAAVKQCAINMTRKDSGNIEWIKNIPGNLTQVINELMRCEYCFTAVKFVSK